MYKHSNKVGRKIHQKTTILKNDRGKESQQDSPTPVARGASGGSADKSVVHFLSPDNYLNLYLCIIVSVG